ncbi:MYB DNA-binding protein domain-containing protein [Sporothrix schenckii 1099-18]|uniref:MYB DNA-binding protein domain-containing protein n=1 Tax=Sporothrix schenckii 1099-18 TaxID=1397361 RepID=A0A0F2MAQ5_SPOSC|nr:MYB DNA-binding protein domain-containing protein [Sporothrix schenckii 1099-18]KJR86722.1 MYB DNA-binding protein domain-containing protein [Sporothrix schenckii 1099-18]
MRSFFESHFSHSLTVRNAEDIHQAAERPHRRQSQASNNGNNPPSGAPVYQILSLQSPATSQSGSLWRNPCIDDTLASNYRVGSDYNVDYSPQDSHPGEQQHNQAPQAYEPQQHHSRPSLHHIGTGTSLHDTTAAAHHQQQQQQQQQQQSHHHTMSHHHAAAAHHPHQVLMDPSQMGAHHAAAAAARHLGHHPGQAHYGAPVPSPHAVVTPLYPGLTAGPVGTTAGVKRTRPEDLDLSVSGMPDLEQSDLDSMGAYGQPTGTPQQATPQSLPPTHHHHRLPDTGPPSKMMRRDGEGGGGGGGGAPSVVGQAGMPPPAPRPRGPKLKFTPEDDQLLIDLKENKSLTWKQIADFFPGRSSGTLQVRYCTKLKAKTTQWTDETDQKLRTALQDYENEKWRIVANKVGTGFTPAACRERAAQMMGGPL